ncbi:hypothetical protein F0562_006568 [Nyssa sinensis]|uniref:PNPLA domain-containing protein n=1 Tax=Nyssa sinensis TaxID=561372 RepID=A0A5J5AKZ1_9ASTE|nr:hypothetical protein F0562_006568 [Nyssa sinensis]
MEAIVTSSVQATTSCLQIRPPTHGKFIRILSIDGGGIRGLIPAVILEYLESQLQVRTNHLIDAQLSDICISTSAAPTYLPAHYFTNQDQQGNERQFNLIDGGVAANNPALVAISEVTKQLFEENPDFFPIKPMEYDHFLVLSIGTGSGKNENKYNAGMASKWGILTWLYNNGSTPLIDVFNQASADMVDFHLCVVFEALRSKDNYLRIQVDSLSGALASVDVATEENLNNLRRVGKELLEKKISHVNINTGRYEEVENGCTNAQALRKFAEALSEERKRQAST